MDKKLLETLWSEARKCSQLVPNLVREAAFQRCPFPENQELAEGDSIDFRGSSKKDEIEDFCFFGMGAK